MDKDILINQLRVAVNNLPLMTDQNQKILVGELNKLLDLHFALGGKFIKTDICGLLPSNTQLKLDGLPCANVKGCEFIEDWCRAGKCDFFTPTT
jgi:hypothetical protein